MTPIEAADGYIRICRITQGDDILETDAWDNVRKVWSEDEHSRRTCVDIVFGLNRKHTEIAEEKVIEILKEYGCSIEPFKPYQAK